MLLLDLNLLCSGTIQHARTRDTRVDFNVYYNIGDNDFAGIDIIEIRVSLRHCNIVTAYVIIR